MAVVHPPHQRYRESPDWKSPFPQLSSLPSCTASVPISTGSHPIPGYSMEYNRMVSPFEFWTCSYCGGDNKTTEMRCVGCGAGVSRSYDPHR